MLERHNLLAFSFLVAVAILQLAVGPAQAQSRMYKCVDAKGKTFYTQTPPTECLGRDTQVLSTKSGAVTSRIEGQITPEQQAQREEEKKGSSLILL